MQNNTYIVNINMRFGQYEKELIRLIVATSIEDAKKKVLVEEAHENIGGGAWWDGGDVVWDLMGEFVYTIDSVKLIDESDYHTIQKYFQP